MPPFIAAIITALLICGLLMRDCRREPNTGLALWLPVAWLIIAGSRFVSQWLQLGDPAAKSNVTEGSPLDAMVFLGLMIAGLVVLVQRQFRLAEFIRRNIWILAFFLFGLISISWSDYSFVAFKRWVKTLGHPIMALVVLTDPDPRRALQLVLKRVAYLLVPLSILFIKYFPQYGRSWDPWTGQGFNTGVGLTKNDLGYVCWILSVFFVWHLGQLWKQAPFPGRRNEMLVSAALLVGIFWLLNAANSATSTACLVIGVTTLAFSGHGILRTRFLGTLVLFGVFVAIVLNEFFHVYERVILALGRDPNLTDRTVVWADAIALQPHPIIGAGFESFWLGYRLEALWSKWWWRPNQAHNGYIETYLNMGVLGVFILSGWIVSSFFKIRKQMARGDSLARLHLALLFAILAFNYTEAAFKGTHFVWTLFFLISIDYLPRVQISNSRERVSRTTPSRPRRPPAGSTGSASG